MKSLVFILHGALVTDLFLYGVKYDSLRVAVVAALLLFTSLGITWAARREVEEEMRKIVTKKEKKNGR